MRSVTKHLFEITIFNGLVIIMLFFLSSVLLPAFWANGFINGAILLVFIFGVLLSYKALYDLWRAQKWTRWFREHDRYLNQPQYQDKRDEPIPLSNEIAARSPRLIRPTATLLNERMQTLGYLQLNSNSMRMILEGLSIRLDEARETLRYVVGLLVFLGLLGTFWGLMQTVMSVGSVIEGLLETQSGNGGNGGNFTQSFQILQQGLQTPLQGMGTAFSSSLFGLAGSLLVGFCALRVSQAQNRFYQDYEEWLSSLTRLSGSTSMEGDTSGMGLAITLLEQTAESVDRLQHFIGRSEQQQGELYTNLAELNKRLGTLIESQKIEHELMRKLAEGQLATRQLLERMVEGNVNSPDLSSQNLKPIEHMLGQIQEANRHNMDHAVRILREELRIVSRTISNSLPNSIPTKLTSKLTKAQADTSKDADLPPPTLPNVGVTSHENSRDDMPRHPPRLKPPPRD